MALGHGFAGEEIIDVRHLTTLPNHGRPFMAGL
jgi:hypothetical protein